MAESGVTEVPVYSRFPVFWVSAWVGVMMDLAILVDPASIGVEWRPWGIVDTLGWDISLSSLFI